ncbi:DUF192 domain-containing protein [Aidingimonas halophila]|uniref:DUF192 domain-containing protein n=1 Tax=Aidingimonas halophila TaxID=574349 RepID=A0A1H2SK59_9GAMM|nr:DUF192 domain-containing protein [Aidingimonas halophila]GHC17544.1 hypothetical protein GCM10008094_03950 [Aidingimonas halophila]SDW31845.1 hypothetical protein SAMN05443545_101581 [Aidingimonas halophila]
MTPRRLLVTVLWLSLTSAVSAGEHASSDMAFDTGTLTIDTGEREERLSVELAKTGQQRSRGLMERDHLDDDAGMLFLYEQERSSRTSFWMYRTRIPLDIAFIDGAGEIAAMRRMPPCEAESPGGCPTYEAGVAYVAALEVNAGYFEERGIDIGDRVALDGESVGRDGER